MTEDQQIASLTGHAPFLRLCARLDARLAEITQELLEETDPDREALMFRYWKNATLWTRKLKTEPAELSLNEGNEF